MELLKNNEMAKKLGMTPSAFAKGVRIGRFTPSKKNEKGENLFNPEVIIRQYESTKNIAETQNYAALMPKVMQGGRPKKNSDKINSDTDTKSNSSKDSEEYLKARLKKIQIDARLSEQKFKVRSGELIEKKDVEKQGAELGAIMKSSIQNWASRLAPVFASMKNADEHDFHQLIQKESNDLIIEIRKYCGVID